MKHSVVSKEYYKDTYIKKLEVGDGNVYDKKDKIHSILGGLWYDNKCINLPKLEKLNIENKKKNLSIGQQNHQLQYEGLR